MIRRWIVAVAGVLALAIAALAYHLLVTAHSKKHFDLFQAAHRVEEKRLHFEEMHRFFHPFDPYRTRAEEILEEEGHEWNYFLQKYRSSVQER